MQLHCSILVLTVVLADFISCDRIIDSKLPICDPGWTHYNNACYKLPGDCLNWHDAKAACERMSSRDLNTLSMEPYRWPRLNTLDGDGLRRSVLAVPRCRDEAYFMMNHTADKNIGCGRTTALTNEEDIPWPYIWIGVDNNNPRLDVGGTQLTWSHWFPPSLMNGWGCAMTAVKHTGVNGYSLNGVWLRVGCNTEMAYMCRKPARDLAARSFSRNACVRHGNRNTWFEIGKGFFNGHELCLCEARDIMRCRLGYLPPSRAHDGRGCSEPQERGVVCRHRQCNNNCLQYQRCKWHNITPSGLVRCGNEFPPGLFNWGGYGITSEPFPVDP